MEVTVEEARRMYLATVDDHISPEAIAHNKLASILHSELAVSLFVPSNWEGVRMEPFELHFVDSMPPELKPRARPVNPKLYDKYW
jgi:hypothetical protein